MRKKKTIGMVGAVFLALLVFTNPSMAWTPLAVSDDPLLRMPGTQPGQAVLEAPDRCLNCHEDPAFPELPGSNWKGSMMAQAARDFLYWSCLAVGAQDSIWAVGTPNATDICLRCHMPMGWLEGRSDPTSGSAMNRADFDGVQCDFCHNAWNPFFQATHAGTREGSDWLNYWDETNASATPSQPAADVTYAEDATLARVISLFNGAAFYVNNLPVSDRYTENGAGQYFVSPNGQKRAGFADAQARHQMLYSRYHKSKFFCSTCHDVSNPVLANLGADPTLPLPTETEPAFSYYHVERTFSEFMLSDYGLQGGAPGLGPFSPGNFATSLANNNIARCQDCHLPDVVGYGCNKNGSILRPTGSIEHPESGQPLHDMTGGNGWVSWVLASAVTGSPNYDATNDQLLHQGPAVLTLDMTAGLGVDPVALLAGVDRARQQLQMAASIQNVSYDPATGALSFRIQNQTGHKLISGFPEGRRMFINIKAYDQAGNLIAEVNPYDSAAGTLKGLEYPYSTDPAVLPLPQPLAATEAHVDSLVYEMKPTSSLTGEAKTFHFALATGRYKDNRIPPKGFRIAEAASRISEPVVGGLSAADLFTAAEYAGGYDDVTYSLVTGASYVEVNLFYQTTSREYVEFLRDEILGTGNLTLSSPTPSGEPQAYIIQTDPFFNQLRAWGDTLWQLWTHNMNVPGAAPFLMAQATAGAPPTPVCETPGTPQNLTATAGRRQVVLDWQAGAPAPTGGYNIYYDLGGGKLQLIATVNPATLSYTDPGLQRNTTYCYVVKAWNDCDGNGAFEISTDTESPPSSTACATP